MEPTELATVISATAQTFTPEQLRSIQEILMKDALPLWLQIIIPLLSALTGGFLVIGGYLLIENRRRKQKVYYQVMREARDACIRFAHQFQEYVVSILTEQPEAYNKKLAAVFESYARARTLCPPAIQEAVDATLPILDELARMSFDYKLSPHELEAALTDKQTEARAHINELLKLVSIYFGDVTVTHLN